MKKQGASRCYIYKQINKGFLSYPDDFKEFGVRILEGTGRRIQLKFKENESHLKLFFIEPLFIIWLPF